MFVITFKNFLSLKRFIEMINHKIATKVNQRQQPETHKDKLIKGFLSSMRSCTWMHPKHFQSFYSCKQPSNNLQTAFKQPANNLQIAFRQPSNSLQTAFKQPTKQPANSLKTTFKQLTNSLQNSLKTAYKKPANRLPRSCNQPANSLQTACKQHSNNVQTSCKQPSTSLQTAWKSCWSMLDFQQGEHANTLSSAAPATLHISKWIYTIKHSYLRSGCDVFSSADKEEDFISSGGGEEDWIRFLQWALLQTAHPDWSVN